MKAADISDAEMLAVIDEIVSMGNAVDLMVEGRTSGYRTAPLYLIEKRLSKYPAKVVLSKLRQMSKTGRVWCECTCGCNGKYQNPKNPKASRLLAMNVPEKGEL